ncbi:MAG: hypothetical protein ACI8ZW_002384, partial [Yoonia sp.]
QYFKNKNGERMMRPPFFCAEMKQTLLSHPPTFAL